MQKAKGKAVTALTGGIEYLFKKYGVEYLKGKGSLAGPHTVSAATSSSPTLWTPPPFLMYPLYVNSR